MDGPMAIRPEPSQNQIPFSRLTLGFLACMSTSVVQV